MLPVTTATVEHPKSSVKFIKTSLRSTMTKTRLNSLLLLFIHRDRPLNYDAIIDACDKVYPHRMQLSRLLEVETNYDDGEDEENIL